MATAEKEGMDGGSYNGWKSFLPRPSPLMVERSGIVVCAQRRTCGQGRNVRGVRGVRETFRQCCKGSASKRSRQRPGGTHGTRLQ